jgi:hypothetical protein
MKDRLGEAGGETLAEVEAALATVLGLDRPPVPAPAVG